MRIFGHYVPGISISLAGLETALSALVLVALANHLGLLALGRDAAVPISSLAPVAIAVVLTFIIFYSVGLYKKANLISWSRLAPRTIVVGGFAFIVVGLAYTLERAAGGLFGSEGPLTSRAWLFALSTASSIGALLIVRCTLVNVCATDMLKRRILVLGNGPKAEAVKRILGQPEHESFVRAFFMELTAPVQPTPRNSPFRLQFDGSQPIYEYARSQDIDQIVVALTERRGMPIHDLLACRMGHIEVVDDTTFLENTERRVQIDGMLPSSLVFSDGFRTSSVYWTAKRALDVTVSALFLLFMLPVMALAALAIRLEGPGPILFRQERVGLGGRTFTLYKFRSMRTDAERAGPQWASERDSRVTRVGAFIRRTRIDEIPQVLNVLRGEMSFIGPRPERPVFVRELSAEIPFYNERHRVKPGITGWAQVNFPYGASVEDAKMKLSHDLYYIKNLSLLLDLLILFQTVRIVLWREGSR